MESLLIFGVIIAVIILCVVIKSINNKRFEKTKELSVLYKSILSLNKEYKFYSDASDLNFNPALKSKRSLDKFDLTQYVAEKLNENRSFYKSLFQHAEQNAKDYNEYCAKYSKLEKYTTEEEFSKYEDVKMSYKTFRKNEEKLFQSSKLNQPKTTINAHCHATYTSPSGRNHYWRDSYYSLYDLKQLVKEMENHEEYLRKEQERKNKALEEKRAKEKRLRELDKLETRLAQKEKEINEKEKEFLEATKEHIYTAEKIEVNTNEIEIDENLSLSQKLKLLKEKYDNGEITYEEYQAKRKEIM